MATYSIANGVEVYSQIVEQGAGTASNSLVYTIPAYVRFAYATLKWIGGSNLDGGGGPTLNVKVGRYNRPTGNRDDYSVIGNINTINFSPVMYYNNLTWFSGGSASGTSGAANYSMSTVPCFAGDQIVYDKTGAAGPNDIVNFEILIFQVI